MVLSIFHLVVMVTDLCIHCRRYVGKQDAIYEKKHLLLMPNSE